MLLTLTLLLVFLYIACTNYIIHSSMPCFCMAHQITFFGTRSNAFSRSTKVKYNFLFLARCLSCKLSEDEYYINCLRMNIASVVPSPDMKPNCMSSMNTLSLMIFSITLNYFHDMIKEFKTSVVIPYQSITLPLVEVDDKTIFSVR